MSRVLTKLYSTLRPILTVLVSATFKCFIQLSNDSTFEYLNVEHTAARAWMGKEVAFGDGAVIFENTAFEFQKG